MDSASKSPHILIYGFGAVGILYAYILEQAGAKVTAIARSTYSAIKDNGVHIKSKKFGEVKNWSPYRTFATPEEAADGTEYSYILCTFKCLPDSAPTVNLIKPFIESTKPGTPLPTIVLMQNGIGIEKPVQEAFPQHTVISVAIWIGANVISDKDGNVALEHGQLERLDMGIYEGDGRKSENSPYKATQVSKERLAEFIRLLNAGGGATTTPEDMQAARWDKSLWNAVFSVFCTLARLPVQGMVNSNVREVVIPQARKGMHEVIKVARALGFGEDVLPSTKVEAVLEMTVKAYEDQEGSEKFKPSMLIDVEMNRPIELHPIVGSIVEHARALNIDVPILEMSHAILFSYQSEILKRQRS